MSNYCKPILIIGDIHAAFGRLKEQVEQLDLRSCYLICVGDLGIGFQHPAKGEMHAVKKLNTLFAERDISFMSIRGNHDDPEYFNGAKQINLSHFRLLPDYYHEVINGERFLFVGGAISIDRYYREVGRSYWIGEKFNYDESKIVDCDVLITHSAPTWNGPFDKAGLSGWCEKDKTLWDECFEERKNHDKLIVKSKAKMHYAGHFHEYHWVEFKDCYSTILSIEQIKEHRLLNI